MQQIEEIMNDLEECLNQLPGAGTFHGRDLLVEGLPDVNLGRSEYESKEVDIHSIVTGWQRLGRVKGGTAWPLIVITEKAIVMARGTDLAADLETVKQRLVAFYSESPPPGWCLSEPTTKGSHLGRRRMCAWATVSLKARVAPPRASRA